MVTSSAVVGSSASTTSGSLAMAIAIITRWRMPPENWCGYSSMRRSECWLHKKDAIPAGLEAPLEREALAVAEEA